MSEETLVEQVARFFVERGYDVDREVPFWLRRIDLVAHRGAGLDVVAVEAKLTKWQSALRQAKVCQLCAPHVFVAMPAKFAHRCDRAALGRLGIGLLAVETEVEEVVRARRSPVLRVAHQRDLARTLDRRRKSRGEVHDGGDTDGGEAS